MSFPPRDDSSSGLALPTPTAVPVKMAASYARTAQHDPEALAEQHHLNVRQAEADGYVIPDDSSFLFSDCGVSGHKLSRPGLDSLVNLIKSGDATFDRIYLKDRSRVFRHHDLRHVLGFEDFMRSHGVQVRYISD